MRTIRQDDVLEGCCSENENENERTIERRDLDCQRRTVEMMSMNYENRRE